MTQMLKEIQQQPEVLRNCLKTNSDTIAEIVKLVTKRNIYSVYIAARGTSDHAAVYGKYMIEILTGIPVALAASSVFTLYNKNLNLQNTLVIGISQSGKAADVLEVIKSSKKCGAITVSITNYDDSPLASEAQFHLNCSAGPELSVAATKTFTSQMMLLAKLAAEWADNKQLAQDLFIVPEKVSETLETANLIKNKVQKYVFMEECFVLARGINYSIALECALKIQETTYVRAKAFATSDFYHGPLAMLDKRIPVIVFAPYGPTLNDMSVIIDKLIEHDIDTIIVSNDKHLLERTQCSFSIPSGITDMISPFCNVTIAQIFACELSKAKGLNPDKPRSLSKVTITR